MSTQELNLIESKLNAIKAQYEATVANIREIGFTSLLAGLFEDAPEIKAFYWHQYIPGFNDGDPCVFTMGDTFVADATADLDVAGKSYLDDYEGWHCTHSWYAYEWILDPETNSKKYTQVGYKTDKPLFNEGFAELGKFIKNNPKLMEDLFGSNAWILITPTELTTEYYDCGY